MQWVWACKLTIPFLQVHAEPPLAQLCRLTSGVGSQLLGLRKFLESGRISGSLLLISHCISSTAHQIRL